MTTHRKAFPRITISSKQMGGMPCIRGFRISAATVVGKVTEGMSEANILDDYPDLESEDIKEAMRFTAEASRLGAWPSDENCQEY